MAGQELLDLARILRVPADVLGIKAARMGLSTQDLQKVMQWHQDNDTPLTEVQSALVSLATVQEKSAQDFPRLFEGMLEYGRRRRNALLELAAKSGNKSLISTITDITRRTAEADDEQIARAVEEGRLPEDHPLAMRVSTQKSTAPGLTPVSTPTREAEVGDKAVESVVKSVTPKVPGVDINIVTPFTSAAGWREQGAAPGDLAAAPASTSAPRTAAPATAPAPTAQAPAAAGDVGRTSGTVYVGLMESCPAGHYKAGNTSRYNSTRGVMETVSVCMPNTVTTNPPANPPANPPVNPPVSPPGNPYQLNTYQPNPNLPNYQPNLNVPNAPAPIQRSGRDQPTLLEGYMAGRGSHAHPTAYRGFD